MRFHDTHFHLDLFPDPHKVASLIEKEGIYTIAVTNTPSVFDFTYALTKETKFIRAALGLHPELANERQYEMPTFLKHLSLTRYIGEIGLDNYNKSAEDYVVQKKVFQKIIDSCALATDKIITIHSRRAASDVINTIGNNFPGKIILHWYSGSLKDLKIALSFGFYFSINYAMAQSDSGKRIIDAIPTERILLETDGPFVQYENLPATPAIVGIIAEKINIIKRLNFGPTEIEFLFTDNFKRLLS